MYILTLNYQVNRLYNLKILKDLKQSLAVLLLEYWSILMFAH